MTALAWRTPARDDLTRKLGVLRDRCREEGRDYAAIEKTTATGLELGEDGPADPRRLVTHLRELGGMGIDHVLLAPRGPWDEASLDVVTFRLM